MTPFHPDIRFRHLDPSSDLIHLCAHPRCNQPATWQITFTLDTETLPTHQPTKRFYCWPHAIHWCANNLATPTPTPKPAA